LTRADTLVVHRRWAGRIKKPAPTHRGGQVLGRAASRQSRQTTSNDAAPLYTHISSLITSLHYGQPSRRPRLLARSHEASLGPPDSFSPTTSRGAPRSPGQFSPTLGRLAGSAPHTGVFPISAGRSSAALQLLTRLVQCQGKLCPSTPPAIRNHYLALDFLAGLNGSIRILCLRLIKSNMGSTS